MVGAALVLDRGTCDRARMAAARASDLDLPKDSYESPLSHEVREVATRRLEDGAIEEAIAAVARGDPELA